MFKVQGDSIGGSHDLFTWFGLLGANVIVFVNVMRGIAKYVLFVDPVLKRLKHINAR